MTTVKVSAQDIKMLLDAALASYIVFAKASIPWVEEVKGDIEQTYVRQQTARAIIMAHVSKGTAVKSLDTSGVLDLNMMIEQYMLYLDEKASKIETSLIIAEMMKTDA